MTSNLSNFRTDSDGRSVTRTRSMQTVQRTDAADVVMATTTSSRSANQIADMTGCGRFARMSARMSVSWNAVFMQLYVSAKRPTLSA